MKFQISKEDRKRLHALDHNLRQIMSHALFTSSEVFKQDAAEISNNKDWDQQNEGLKRVHAQLQKQSEEAYEVHCVIEDSDYGLI